MNVLSTAATGGVALLAAIAWAAEPAPKVNLIGRPVPEIDSLPEGPYRDQVAQGHELSTRTFAVIGPEVKNPRQRYAGNNLNRLLTTTRFIRQNMPLGASHTATVLNDDEAYVVTAFMLSKPRSIKAHLEADFPARWNKPIDAAFPPYLLGATADQHKYGPFPPLAEKQREVAKRMAEQRKAEMAASKVRAAAKPASAAVGK